MQYNRARSISPPPPLGSVGVLYVLPWILAVVGGIVMCESAFFFSIVA